MNAIAPEFSADGLIDHYREHLIEVAGLQSSTCKKWTYFVRSFLKAQFPSTYPTLGVVGQLRPQALLEFVLEQGDYYAPGQLQSLATALRSFCRYLCVTGQHAQDLSGALPRISGYHREDLPTYLTNPQLNRLLGGFDRRTLVGKRDYAMVLCMGRLGLRAGEVARLSLDDIDWRQGSLRLIAPKGRRDRQLPLTAEVGQALANYLRRAKAGGLTRALFRSLCAQKALSPRAVSRRVGRALVRVGLAAPGQSAHLLRRTAATHLVQRGVSLKSVADLLGHASLRTTQVYAKVNLPMLRALCQPWPLEVRP